MAATFADGQLAASSGTILGASSSERSVTVILCNTSASASETVILTVSRANGTARRVARVVLAANESAHAVNLPLDPSDVLAGYASDASVVDYVVAVAQGGAFEVRVYDASGSLKTVQSGTPSNFTVGGDLTVSGGDIDAGASGTAGSVDIFPSTASKGKTTFTATANTGDTTTTITTAAQATTRTYTVPDALASADFLLGKQAAVARTASADGTGTGTIADGGMYQHVTVTSANADHIVILPTPTPGTTIVLDVGANGFELRSSAPATVAINGGSGADAESAIAANSTVFMTCVSATAWKGYFMDADGDLAKVEAAAA